jgi:hypothetical protein
MEKKNQIPKSISTAAKLIYLSLVVGFINAVILEYTTSFKNLSDPQKLIVLSLSVGLMAFFGFKIQMGKKWARNIFLVMSILMCFTFPNTLIQFFKLNPLTGIISIFQVGLLIFSLYLLFNRNSTEWYYKSKIVME